MTTDAALAHIAAAGWRIYLLHQDLDHRWQVTLRRGTEERVVKADTLCAALVAAVPATPVVEDLL